MKTMMVLVSLATLGILLLLAPTFSSLVNPKVDSLIQQLEGGSFSYIPEGLRNECFTSSLVSRELFFKPSENTAMQKIGMTPPPPEAIVCRRTRLSERLGTQLCDDTPSMSAAGLCLGGMGADAEEAAPALLRLATTGAADRGGEVPVHHRSLAVWALHRISGQQHLPSIHRRLCANPTALARNDTECRVLAKLLERPHSAAEDPSPPPTAPVSESELPANTSDSQAKQHKTSRSKAAGMSQSCQDQVAQPAFQAFLQALKSSVTQRDTNALDPLIHYPLKSNAVQGDRWVRNKAELSAQIQRIASTKVRNALAINDPKQFICRDGQIGLPRGAIWTKKIDGQHKIVAIWSQDRAFFFNCETQNYRVVVTAVRGNYHYKSWRRPIDPAAEPDLTLTSGDNRQYGSGVCGYSASNFDNNEYRYEVRQGIGCGQSTVDELATGWLIVEQGSQEILRELCFARAEDIPPTH